MSEHFPSRAANQVVPPANTGDYAGTATSTTTSAANLTLPVTFGGAYFTFQARGGDVYVRFKSTASTAATTSGDGSNGLKIADGQSVSFWITTASKYADHICSAASKYLFWWQSSPNFTKAP